MNDKRVKLITIIFNCLSLLWILLHMLHRNIQDVLLYNALITVFCVIIFTVDLQMTRKALQQLYHSAD